MNTPTPTRRPRGRPASKKDKNRRPMPVRADRDRPMQWFFEEVPRQSSEEQTAMWQMVATVKRILQEQNRPDAFNVGINIGDAAGQTVGHAHIHVVPRYSGDATDPRGGVRWIIPSKARYWTREPSTTDDRGVIGLPEKMLGLLDEGRFTATYKYAVLLGLMDLCIENTTAAGTLANHRAL